MFGPGGSENILLNIEVQELCSMNRATQRMAQGESAAMEQHARLARFHQYQGFQQAVQEHQHRARDAVNQAVFESSARCETALIVGISGCTAYQRIDHGDEETRTFSELVANLKQHEGIQRGHMLTGYGELVLERCPRVRYSASYGF